MLHNLSFAYAPAIFFTMAAGLLITSLFHAEPARVVPYASYFALLAIAFEQRLLRHQINTLADLLVERLPVRHFSETRKEDTPAEAQEGPTHTGPDGKGH